MTREEDELMQPTWTVQDDMSDYQREWEAQHPMKEVEIPERPF